MPRKCAVTTIVMLGFSGAVLAQTPAQPKVAPGPNEPDWVVILKDRYGLSMFDDLANPVRTKPEESAGLFRRAGPGPVRYRPVIALGLETRTRGGWYNPPKDSGALPRKTELWDYAVKNVTDDLKTGKNLPPSLSDRSTTEFDPGSSPFGVWVSNDQFDDGGVFTEPGLVARINRRVGKQPYKAMIYPNRDKSTGKTIPNSYLIGWEYSTNDDFQDVVCQIDNVILVEERRGPDAKSGP
jgi:hypothetical protein